MVSGGGIARRSKRPGALASALLAAIVAGGHAPGASAQRREPDSEATRAFERLVDATRARAPFEVRTSLVIQVIEGAHSRAAPAVEATLRFDPTSSPPRAALQISGFDVLVADGRVVVTHASNDRDYVAFEDDGAPYYALLGAFVDLPYPHLGIVLGERNPAELLSQLSSRAAWIVPTRVESIHPEPGTDDASDQPERNLLHLTSDFESMKLELDPGTQAIQSMTLDITGGPMVREGTALRIELRCRDRDLPEEEARNAFSFEPGDRRRIDSILALVRGSGAGSGMVERAEGGGSLVGRPAPDFAVPRFDQGELDSANYRGRKVMVIDFWATWCGPCRVTLPKLDAAARTMEAKGWPVVVAAVNTMEGLDGDALRRKVDAFWKDKGYSMVLALDEGAEAAEAFGVRGIPHTFVIGLDGIVAWEHIGGSDRYEELVIKAVERALAAAGAAPNGHGRMDRAPPPGGEGGEPEVP